MTIKSLLPIYKNNTTFYVNDKVFSRDEVAERFGFDRVEKIDVNAGQVALTVRTGKTYDLNTPDVFVKIRQLFRRGLIDRDEMFHCLAQCGDDYGWGYDEALEVVKTWWNDRDFTDEDMVMILTSGR